MAAVAVLVAGCAGEQDPTTPGGSTDDATTATPSSAATDAVPADVLDEAVQLAVDRTGAAAEELDLRAADGGPIRLCEGGGEPPMGDGGG